MSRIGKQLIVIPNSVTVALEGGQVTVTGAKGTISRVIPQRIKVEVVNNQVVVTRTGDDKPTKANHGTTRAHINNMILGVQNPWVKELEVRGTGYKAQLNGDKLKLLVGFIHPVEIQAPEGVFFQVAEDTKITVSGIDKTKVGQTASNIRKVKPPEPYKGKGIRYINEFIKLKAGKKAKTA